MVGADLLCGKLARLDAIEAWPADSMEVFISGNLGLTETMTTFGLTLFPCSNSSFLLFFAFFFLVEGVQIFLIIGIYHIFISFYPTCDYLGIYIATTKTHMTYMSRHISIYRHVPHSKL